jgi:YesN/AraC family two-component response regulator
LAELVQSNHAYVSQVINNSLKKNFRSLLNAYRISEAQRILATPDAAKFTLESIAYQVGFKSRTAFRDAFKEITGVSPNYYFKLTQENLKHQI